MREEKAEKFHTHTHTTGWLHPSAPPLPKSAACCHCIGHSHVTFLLNCEFSQREKEAKRRGNDRRAARALIDVLDSMKNDLSYKQTVLYRLVRPLLKKRRVSRGEARNRRTRVVRLPCRFVLAVGCHGAEVSPFGPLDFVVDDLQLRRHELVPKREILSKKCCRSTFVSS